MSVRAAMPAAVDRRSALLRAAAIGAGASFVLLLIPGIWLEVLERSDARIRDSLAVIAIDSLAVLTTASVGAFLALRRPGNAIGWLLMALGWIWAVSGLTDLYASYSLLQRHTPLPAAREVASVGAYTWPPVFALLVLIVVSFPEGRPVSRTRRAVALGAVVAAAVACVFGVLSQDTLDAPLEHVTPAFSIIGTPGLVITVVAIFALFACLIGCAVDVVLRLRRARGLERRQLICFAYVALLVPFSLAVCLAFKNAFGLGDLLVGIALSASIIALPIATAIAILRHRLYAIDRIVNRTLVYLLITALLGASYLVLVVSLTRAFATIVHDPSSLAIALTTVLVTAAFLPVRARVQRSVDRRFARRRFAAVNMVEQFATRLRLDREPPERIGAVLAEALRDPGLVVAFPRLRGDEWLDPYGATVAGTYAGAMTLVGPVDEPTALLLHDPVLDEDPDVLGAVSAAARLPLEIARLRVEVRGQLEDVRASRARIVAAQDAERRRVERDIHDGAQQRLVALSLTLQVARRRHDGGGTVDLAELLDATSAELGTAVEELRELARGVYPAVLREDGLGEALRALARRTPLPVEVVAELPRIDGGIEAAAYFLASEAVTNAVRHAAASRISITAEMLGDVLCVRVADDGVGGAVASGGSGLAGLADRLAALGGSVRIESAAGEGTTVTGELPCGS
jgi:signal transduction histidine kinase